MAIRLIECSSDAEWDMFISNSPHGNVFSMSSFLAALDVANEKLFLQMDGEIVASALILEPHVSGFRAPYPYTLYQGLALSPVRGNGHSLVTRSLKIIEELNHALSERYASFSFCLSPALTDLRGFQWFNYHTPDSGLFNLNLQYTGIIDLTQYSSFDEYVMSIRSSRRQDAKKALKHDFSIEESRDSDAFLSLYRLTFDRQGIAIDESNMSKVKRIVDVVLSRGIGKLIFCREKNGAPRSAVVSIFDSRCTYYMFGATDPDFRSSGAHTALLLDCIKRSYFSGRMQFDMVGINSPQRGDFKTSFNANPVPFYSLSFERMAARHAHATKEQHFD